MIVRSLTLLAVAACLPIAAHAKDKADGQPKIEEGFVRLFDGETLDGWKASENKDSCQVKDGTLAIGGPRSHLFYVGDVQGANFKNFELKCDVKTTPGSNSGIYFHTKYLEEGWPNKGYEAQINNTHGDPKKTGGLYSVQDVFEAPAKDNEWFSYHIIVKGKSITIKINDKTTVDYTEPDDLDRPERQLDSGTFAFQAHDPKSMVYIRNVRVKVLP